MIFHAVAGRREPLRSYDGLFEVDFLRNHNALRSHAPLPTSAGPRNGFSIEAALPSNAIPKVPDMRERCCRW